MESAMRIPMTPKGYEALKTELERLRKVDRPKNIQDIAEAREHGDLRENAEFKAAKERQAFLDTRIGEIEQKLGQADVIEIGTGTSDTVVFGTTVRIRALESDELKTYTLLGQEEADVKNGLISVQSPLGRQLIGRHVGDVVQVTLPAGMIEYEIQDIFFRE
ncbi:MAG: transcription elongation factor GreA [Nitrospira sp.]|nr:transcription elongation factor GreA [Nitrospira sp.]MDD9860546.1 transcription elongation factor GreA [Nitrospira sp.]